MNTSVDRIYVVGIGDAGNNVINHILHEGLGRLRCVAVNTNDLALRQSVARIKVPIGQMITKGLGAAGDPQKGKQAAEETSRVLYEVLHDADQVVLVAGMGGGTGSGATAVIARIAREQGARVSAVMQYPFTFEGTQRQQIAQNTLQQLEPWVDDMTVITADDLLRLVKPNPTLADAFRLLDSKMAWNVIRALI